MPCALITGASSGLGLELARSFARDGHSVILVARRRDRLENLARELKSQNSQIQVDVIAMDLSHPGAGRDLFAKVGALNRQVDFLINNAGFGTSGDFANLPLDKELELIDLNVRTLVELTHLFLPAMITRQRGHILNVGSIAGFQPGPYMANYYASKAFVNSFSEAMHEELRGTGVSCTVLAPGVTATEFAQTAGLGKSMLFTRLPLATSAVVANYGYRAMMSGRATAIPGILNKIQTQTLRLLPRRLVRKMVGRINRTVK